KAREYAGTPKAELSLPKELKAADLLNFICAEYNLENFKNTLILALNEDYVEDSEELVLLEEGDELAVIPPISGG
uniref:Molybdopterin synthase sulfur carrier subunit n=1 Tax=Megaselia scalaris TaxID=36166 RepID=T1GW03_MEGSC